MMRYFKWAMENPGKEKIKSESIKEPKKRGI
jgi:hypothetical protein